MEPQSDTSIPQEIKRPAISDLRDVAMFARLEDRVLERVAEIAESRVVEMGRQLYAQGDLDVPLCLLISGQISSFRTAPDGTVTVVEVSQPSGHAGLQTLPTRLPSLVGVETVSRSRMILIDG